MAFTAVAGRAAIGGLFPRSDREADGGGMDARMSWVKMRVDLPEDPRVLMMAGDLFSREEVLSWAGLSRDSNVTVTVTVSVTVTALLRVWGMVREQAQWDETEDAVVYHCTLDAVTHVARIPLFGAVMESVGWAEQLQTSGGPAVRFPKCRSFLQSSDDKTKQQNRDRQAKHRAKVAASASRDNNVTVTHRVEQSRVEQNNTPLPPQASTEPYQPRDPHELTDAKAEEFRDHVRQAAQHLPAHLQTTTAKTALWKMLCHLWRRDGRVPGSFPFEPRLAVTNWGQLFPDEQTLVDSVAIAVASDYKTLKIYENKRPAARKCDDRPPPCFITGREDDDR